MDRRQKKTRESIFNAFIELLSKKHYNQITVGEIIERADVGRATFYAHFETKDFLLKEFCEELFCHIFDTTQENRDAHKHIFECEAPPSVVLHLLEHLRRNDNNILTLLSCESNELFLRYFEENLKELIRKNPNLFGSKKSDNIPLFSLGFILKSEGMCIKHLYFMQISENRMEWFWRFIFMLFAPAA